MSGSTITSVPTIAFTNAGWIAPSESAIATGLQADWKAAFGSDLAVTTSGSSVPPAGQLIVSQAAVIGDQNNEMVGFLNAVDPAYASGRMQDAIGRLSPGGGFARIPSTPTTLEIDCNGGSLVVLPAGLTIDDPNGNLYALTAAATIAATGSITAQFTCVSNGPTAVPQTVQIQQAYPGWDSATVVSGVKGQLVESHAAFETRRNAALYVNARAPIQAVTGNIWANVAGVISVYGYSNNTASPVTVQGVTIGAYESYIAVVGGTATDIAQAIWAKMPPGSPYYAGNTSETVYDTGYPDPQPSYTVTFEIPTDLTIWFKVGIKSSAAVPANASTLIANAILAAMSGADGGTAAAIGGTVYASRFYCGIAALGTWAQIVYLYIGSANSPAATFTGTMAGTVLTVDTLSTGTLAIGQAVVGSGVADGTYITGGSGTTWAIGISQTIASEGMVTVDPALNDITPNLDQYPAATALDVVVVTV